MLRTNQVIYVGGHPLSAFVWPQIGYRVRRFNRGDPYIIYQIDQSRRQLYLVKESDLPEDGGANVDASVRHVENFDAGWAIDEANPFYQFSQRASG